MQNNKGFTLLELAIVMVVIGLIVGSILVGRELIKGAEIRSTIAQLEQYHAATRTFQSKYSGYPGDLQAGNAAGFGLFTLAGGGARYLGDGNGVINAYETITGTPLCNPLESTGPGLGFGGEMHVFWNHLGQAGLVNAPMGSLDTEGVATDPDPAATMPRSKLGNSNYYYVCAMSKYTNAFPYNAPGNYFHLVGISGGAYSRGTSPNDAYKIDSKTDDGLPNRGAILVGRADADGGVGATFYDEPWNATPAEGNCLTDGADGLDLAANYNTSAGGGDTTCYGLMFRMQ